MRDKHFIAWLVGLLVMPFVLNSYSPYVDRLAANLPLIAGILATIIVSAAVFQMVAPREDRGERGNGAR